MYKRQTFTANTSVEPAHVAANTLLPEAPAPRCSTNVHRPIRCCRFASAGAGGSSSSVYSARAVEGMRETSGSGIELQRLTEVAARVDPLPRLGAAEETGALHSDAAG